MADKTENTVDMDKAREVLNLMAEMLPKMTDREKENLLSWCQGLSCRLNWQIEKSTK